MTVSKLVGPWLIRDQNRVLLTSRQEFNQKMTTTQHQEMINKIYQLVDSHYQDEPNDVLIDELCDAFEDIMGPVTV